jgi:hypothetical protein
VSLRIAFTNIVIVSTYIHCSFLLFLDSLVQPGQLPMNQNAIVWL